ncbi:MAG: ATP-binding cassette domain-containing protein, partial [Bacteroidia bacterium]|nr:ATP-binding cassette domain-containing protein [Bacteroidia bacterium]
MFFFSFMGFITGLINALLFIFINGRINSLMAGEKPDIRWQIFLLALTLWCYVFSRRFLALCLIEFTQGKLHALKSELIGYILKSRFHIVYQKKDQIFNILTRDVIQITEAGNIMANLVGSVIMILGCLTYIAILSWKLFLLTVFVIGIGVVFYLVRMKKITGALKRVRELNDGFTRLLFQIVTGFKEIKTDRKKGKDINDNYVSGNLADFKKNSISAFSGFINAQYISEVFFYLTIGLILLLGGFAINVSKESLVSFVFVLLFIYGPIQYVILLIPIISEANISAKRLIDLKATLADSEETGSDKETQHTDFNKLEVVDLRFTHQKDDTVFEIGPVSFSVEKGEVVFISGANGSGKTTVIMCLLGIYKMQSGAILVNGEQLNDQSDLLFSPVFSDFFLFDKFYGHMDFDREKARYYLDLFGMSTKVEMTENGFSTIELSTGQKKRLALIQCLLEKKPILVLDEW